MNRFMLRSDRTTPAPLMLIAAAAVIASSLIAGIATAADATTVSSSTAGISARAVAVPMMATDTYESELQHYINVRRQAHGLRAVRASSCADQIAESWSSYLAAHFAFYHQSLNRILTACSATYAGETLAKGEVSPRQMVSLWMHSTEHRHILLSPKARRVGIGATPDSTGAWVVAADFMRP